MHGWARSMHGVRCALAVPKCALITVQSGLFNNEQMKAHKNIIAGARLYMVWQGIYIVDPHNYRVPAAVIDI